MTIFDVVASNMLVALESGGASAVTAADWASVISAMTAQISVATIVGVMATIVAACIGIELQQWPISPVQYRGSGPYAGDIFSL